MFSEYLVWLLTNQPSHPIQSTTLPSKLDMIVRCHRAFYAVGARASMHVLYVAPDCTPAYLTPCGEPAKFARKLAALKAEDLYSGDGGVEAAISKGLEKMVAVWRKKGAPVSATLLCFQRHDQMVDGIDRVATIRSEEGMDEWLCRECHLSPIIYENSVLGLVKLPLLEQPCTEWSFKERAIQLCRLRAKDDDECKLIVVSANLPIFVIDEAVLSVSRWMDREGRVYEMVGGHFYRLAEPGSEADINHDIIPRMVLRAHLRTKSIIDLPAESRRSFIKLTASMLHAYTPVLFNPAHSVLFQLSKVLRRVCAQPLHSKPECDLLSQLITTIRKYYDEQSADLFPAVDPDSISSKYSQLRDELMIVAGLDEHVGAIILSAFSLDNQTKRKARTRKIEPAAGGYLAVDRGCPPELAVPSNRLLAAYYYQFIKFTND